MGAKRLGKSSKRKLTESHTELCAAFRGGSDPMPAHTPTPSATPAEYNTSAINVSPPSKSTHNNRSQLSGTSPSPGNSKASLGEASRLAAPRPCVSTSARKRCGSEYVSAGHAGRDDKSREGAAKSTTTAVAAAITRIPSTEPAVLLDFPGQSRPVDERVKGVGREEVLGQDISEGTSHAVGDAARRGVDVVGRGVRVSAAIEPDRPVARDILVSLRFSC